MPQREIVSPLLQSVLASPLPQQPVQLLGQQEGAAVAAPRLEGIKSSLLRATLGEEEDPRDRFGTPTPTGAAFRFLEHLRTPQVALFSAVTAGLSPEIDFGEAFEARVSFRDVLNAGGVPEFFGRGLVDFLGDVVLDPLNLLATPIKGVAIGRRALQFTGNIGFQGIRALERAGLPGVEKSRQALTKAFRGALTTDGRIARRMAVQSQRQTRQASKEILRRMEDFQGRIDEAARVLGMDPADVERAITARVEKAASVYDDLSISDSLLQELGTSGAPIFNLVDEVARVAREGAFDPRGPSVLPRPFNPSEIAPLSQAGEELVAPLVKEFKEGAIKQLQLERAGGLATKDLDSARLDYIMHLIHPDARKILLEDPTFAAFGRTWNPQHASLMARELRDVAVGDLNTLSMQGRLAMTKFKEVPLFIDNPAALDALRAYRGARALSSAKLFDDIAARFGTVIRKPGKTGAKREALNEVAQQLGLSPGASFNEVREAAIKAGMRPFKAKGLENTWANAEVANVVDRYFQIIKDPTALQQFGQTLMGVQNSWKAWTLAIFPEYHTRNVVGNVWNNFLAGMGPREAPFYSQAAALQTIIRKGLLTPSAVKRLTNAARTPVAGAADEIIKVGNIRKTAQAWLDEIAEGGVSRGGIFGAELDRAGREISGAGTSGIRRFLRGDTAIVKKGFDIGSAFEDNARIAHYLWRRSNGDAPTKAASSVKKFLFNYDELDPFTETGRVFMPFLTWTRNNIPLQLEHLVATPQKASLINKFRILIEGQGAQAEAPDERFLADWVRENMGIRVRRTGPNDYDFFLLENWIPLADLSEVGLFQLEEGLGAFADKGFTAAVGLLSPLITIPVELVSGKSLFFDREFLPERREFLGVDVPEPIVNTLKAIRVLSVLDRFIAPPRGSTLGKQIVRTATGINLVPQDILRGRRAAASRARIEDLEIIRAYRRALDNGRLREADRLQRKLVAQRRARTQ